MRTRHQVAQAAEAVGALGLGGGTQAAHLAQAGFAAQVALGAGAHRLAQLGQDAGLRQGEALGVDHGQPDAVELGVALDDLVEGGGVGEVGQGDRPVQGRG